MLRGSVPFLLAIELCRGGEAPQWDGQYKLTVSIWSVPVDHLRLLAAAIVELPKSTLEAVPDQAATAILSDRDKIKYQRN